MSQPVAVPENQPTRSDACRRPWADNDSERVYPATRHSNASPRELCAPGSLIESSQILGFSDVKGNMDGTAKPKDDPKNTGQSERRDRRQHHLHRPPRRTASDHPRRPRADGHHRSRAEGVTRPALAGHRARDLRRRLLGGRLDFHGPERRREEVQGRYRASSDRDGARRRRLRPRAGGRRGDREQRATARVSASVSDDGKKLTTEIEASNLPTGHRLAFRIDLLEGGEISESVYRRMSGPTTTATSPRRSRPSCRPGNTPRSGSRRTPAPPPPPATTSPPCGPKPPTARGPAA